MKNKSKLILLFAFCLSTGMSVAQESANASGGEAFLKRFNIDYKNIYV